MELRVNVLLVAAAIVVLVITSLAALRFTDIDTTVVVAVLGLGLSPLGMICKELLTDPPSPQVPAHIVAQMLDK